MTTKFNLEIEIPVKVLGDVEVQANTLEEALNLGMEKYWAQKPTINLHLDQFNEEGFPISAWIGSLDGEHTLFTEDEIEQAWEYVKKVRGRK